MCYGVKKRWWQMKKNKHFLDMQKYAKSFEFVVLDLLNINGLWKNLST